MEFKIFSIMILILMLSSFLIASGETIQKKTIKDSNQKNIVDIRVALYTDEEENEDFYSDFRRTRYFVYAIKDYNWTVGDTKYRFKLDFVNTKMVLKGMLTTDNYDVMIFPPDQVDTKISSAFFRNQPKNIIERQRIKAFISQGGGYFGTCAGAIIAGSTVNEPTSWIDHSYKSLCYDFAEVDVDFHHGMPLFGQLRGHPTENMGIGAYLWYSGWNQSDYDINFHTGLCIDVPLNKNTSIFEDYIGDTCRIRWIAGPALVIPEDPISEIQVLATYPKEEITNNESIQIHHWNYTGGYIGLLKGLFYKGGDIHYYEHLGLIIKSFVFAGDWQKTNKLVETNFSNRPFMTSEIYPNENKARIVRCVAHPEDNVWWGGHIEEIKDTEYNNQYEGFYKWTNITPENETIEDEFSYNYWLLRRSVAWASKIVPDHDLPAIYGESEVCDFEIESKPLNFNITCNVKTEEDPIEIDLYYRHSDDLENWSEYTFFGTDNKSSDGYGFEFNSPDGIGYYEFYSIRRVSTINGTVERPPPGADSKVNVYN